MLRTMTFVVLMIVTIGNAWSDPPQSVSRFPGLRARFGWVGVRVVEALYRSKFATPQGLT